MIWVAVLKPNIIGMPIFRDDHRLVAWHGCRSCSLRSHRSFSGDRLVARKDGPGLIGHGTLVTRLSCQYEPRPPPFDLYVPVQVMLQVPVQQPLFAEVEIEDV